MKSRFLGSFFFTKQKSDSLKKIRIIKQNLIHVQGLPKSLINAEILKSNECFGQYGTIKDVILSKKINPENNKEKCSVYITYENKIEAACAILCVDSLLICGKIIRAFFGTTKYCSHFLNNQKCPNAEKCMFLHKLVTNEEIIIDDNTNFSYNEHLNMSKKIIEQSNLDTKKILFRKRKKSKNILPSIDFIFLSEEQKENYFGLSNISYIRNNEDIIIKNDNFIFNKNYNIIKINNVNNIKLNINITTADINSAKNTKNFNHNQSITINKYEDPAELYNIFKDSIKHILLAKPFFITIRNAPLKEMEYNYLKNDLIKKGVDINIALEGCFDCI